MTAAARPRRQGLRWTSPTNPPRTKWSKWSNFGPGRRVRWTGRVRRARLSLVLGLVLLAGCDRRSETRRERLARWEYEHGVAAVMRLRVCEGLLPEPRPEWPRHDLRLFSLQAPPEFRYEKHRGIDSFVGRFHAPGRVIGFDYGKYSGALQTWHTAAEFRACSMFIDGHVAKIVTARYPDGRYFAGAAWRELAPDRQIHLTIDGASESPAGQREMLAIFRSVRLTPPSSVPRTSQ